MHNFHFFDNEIFKNESTKKLNIFVYLYDFFKSKSLPNNDLDFALRHKLATIEIEKIRAEGIKCFCLVQDLVKKNFRIRSLTDHYADVWRNKNYANSKRLYSCDIENDCPDLIEFFEAFVAEKQMSFPNADQLNTIENKEFELEIHYCDKDTGQEFCKKVFVGNNESLNPYLYNVYCEAKTIHKFLWTGIQRPVS